MESHQVSAPGLCCQLLAVFTHVLLRWLEASPASSCTLALQLREASGTPWQTVYCFRARHVLLCISCMLQHAMPAHAVSEKLPPALAFATTCRLVISAAGTMLRGSMHTCHTAGTQARGSGTLRVECLPPPLSLLPVLKHLACQYPDRHAATLAGPSCMFTREPSTSADYILPVHPATRHCVIVTHSAEVYA